MFQHWRLILQNVQMLWRKLKFWWISSKALWTTHIYTQVFAYFVSVQRSYHANSTYSRAHVATWAGQSLWSVHPGNELLQTSYLLFRSQETYHIIYHCTWDVSGQDATLEGFTKIPVPTASLCFSSWFDSIFFDCPHKFQHSNCSSGGLYSYRKMAWSTFNYFRVAYSKFFSFFFLFSIEIPRKSCL